MRKNEGVEKTVSSSEERNEESGDRARWKPRLIRVSKWLIALLVVIGLIFAGRSAVDQWKAEEGKVKAQIAEIETQLKTATDSTSADLQAQRNALASSLPSWGRSVGVTVLRLGFCMQLDCCPLDSCCEELWCRSARLPVWGR